MTGKKALEQVHSEETVMNNVVSVKLCDEIETKAEC